MPPPPPPPPPLPMPPAPEVDPNPELPRALELLVALFTADELRDAVPTDLVPANRLIAEPDEEPPEAPLAPPVVADESGDPLEATELEDPPEPELSPLLPPLDAPLPPPERPPPPRLTETVIEDESPELSILTDMPPLRPASRGAVSDTYRSAAVTPVRRNVRSTPPCVAVTVRSVATGPCGPPVSGCAARFFSHHSPRPPSVTKSANMPQAIRREGLRTLGLGSGPGSAGRGCLSGAGRPLS